MMETQTKTKENEMKLKDSVNLPELELFVSNSNESEP